MLQFVPPAPPQIVAPAPLRPAGLEAGCTIIGDSIARGIAEQMRACRAEARIGRGSREILNHTPRLSSGTIIVSAGSNDPVNPGLLANLQAIRGLLGGARVVWIAPRHQAAAAKVGEVAMRNGDTIVPLSRFRMRADGVHPLSYQAVASAVRHAMQAITRRRAF